MVVMIDEVKFIFYSVPVGKGARFRVLWLARLLAGSLHRGFPLVVLIVMSNLTVTCCEVNHFWENLREFHFESKKFVM